MKIYVGVLVVVALVADSLLSNAFEIPVEIELDNSACFPSPCQNRGACVPLLDRGYFCSCERGFGGKNCEVRNPCEQNPCLNGGFCQETSKLDDAPYFCVCLPEYTGQRCQIETKCSKNPCLNEGKCRVTNDTLRCDCDVEYTGKYCETLVSPCISSPCKENQVCVLDDSKTSFRCECEAGFVGANCEKFEICRTNPCENDGVCISNGPYLYTCVCNPGYTGINCESRDPCYNFPCKNNGLCRSFEIGSSLHFACICPMKYIGSTCEEKKTCLDNPCLNEGTCQMDNSTDTVNCECKPGFTSEDCSIRIANDCEDSFKFCSTIIKQGSCKLFGSKCKKTCGLC